MLIKSAATVGAVAALATAGPAFHIASVEMCGDAHTVSEAEVRTALAAAGTMSYFAIDLEELASGIAQLQQVRSAQARIAGLRTVSLCVEARLPLARTPDGALIDTSGELYYGRQAGGQPIYDGSPARTGEFLGLYRQLREAGAASGFDVNQIAWRSDGWQVLLGNGWTLRLGRRDLPARVERFAGAYRQLAAAYSDAAGPLTIDLRYLRGLAIAGLEEATAETET